MRLLSLSRATPTVLMLRAVAAARLGQWERVQQILSGEPWLDSAFVGRAHVLLAFAALERGQAEIALAHARRAVTESTAGADHARRLTLLARAFDRLGRLDSARSAYEAAGVLLPRVADWLWLRAAGVTRDPVARRAVLARIQGPAARARIGWTDATALERVSDFDGAARVYDSLGAGASALRVGLLQVLRAGDPVARDSVRRVLIDLLTREPDRSIARLATNVLDRWVESDSTSPLTPAEELQIAHSAVRTGASSRAVRGYAAAFAAALGTDSDHYAYAIALERTGNNRAALAALARLGSVDDRGLSAAAAYERARILVNSGSVAAGRVLLDSLALEYPCDVSGARARMLIADLDTDDGHDSAARGKFLALARDFPASTFAPRARFHAAIIAFAQGDAKSAAIELDSLSARYPNAKDALGALYWSGRAWQRTGNRRRARARWSAAIRRDRLSYYASAAARRLGQRAWVPRPARDHFARLADVDSAMTRARLLEWLGMDVEAKLEYDWLEGTAQTAERALAIGSRLRAHELFSRAESMGRRALALGAAADARTYRLIYPAGDRRLVASAARSVKLEPALVAAVIRQESGFVPRATSGAGARGLMQLMPSVGQAMAATFGLPEWDVVLLYAPEVNVMMGTRHLAHFARQFSSSVRMLAAYNAGGSRVSRWSKKTGADDPELFIERVPFAETRAYVRIVLRNRELYRALYRW